MARRSKPRVQVCRRAFDGQCVLCGERNPVLLHCHRIVPGSRYDFGAVCTLCSNCHNRVHAGQVQIHARLQSSNGPVLHCTIEGEMVYLREWRARNERFKPD